MDMTLLVRASRTIVVSLAFAGAAARAADEGAAERIDYLTFAQGAVEVVCK